MNQWTKRASAAYGYSLTRLALNLYLFAEESEEDKEPKDVCYMRIENNKDCFVRLLKAYLQGELPLENLHELHEAMIQEMDMVVAFTDSFRTYEYALNRMEYDFKTKKPDGLPDDSQFTAKVMNYITQEKNPAIMNRRIQDIIGQLPVRMTRDKFFSILRDALSIYKESDAKSFEQMLYLLRVGGLAWLTNEQREKYPQLDELLQEIEKTDFSSLNQETYERLLHITQLAGERLFLLSEKIQMLQELINDLYVLSLVGTDGMSGEEYEPHALSILQNLQELLELGNGEIPETVEEELSHLEGVQESFLEQYNSLGMLDEKEEHSEKGKVIETLLSGSSFVSLKKQEQGMLRPEEVEKGIDKLITDLNQVFLKAPKSVTRGIMATIMSNLPVFFQSLGEIQEFISGSLTTCLNEGEKAICKELIFQLMEMDDYEVV